MKSRLLNKFGRPRSDRPPGPETSVSPAKNPRTAGRKGRILRVKQGYNPNSSSMGSVIFVLPAAMLAVTAVFGALSGLLAPLFLEKLQSTDSKDGRLYLKLQRYFFNKKINKAREDDKK